MGVRFMLAGDETGGGFSLVEHPIPPRALAAPLHRHSREDEYSFVVEGRLGALLGDEAVYGQPGDLIFKPRGQWHTFWNAGDEPARILEMISPAGFERYFEQMVDLLERSVGAPDPSELGAIAAQHGLEVDRESMCLGWSHRRRQDDPEQVLRWQRERPHRGCRDGNPDWDCRPQLHRTAPLVLSAGSPGFVLTARIRARRARPSRALPLRGRSGSDAVRDPRRSILLALREAELEWRCRSWHRVDHTPTTHAVRGGSRS